MYEDQTFENILERMLDRVPDTIDKREGSIIHDALAPAAAELAQMYIELEAGYALSFADTADSDFLTRRTAEFGVNRFPATKARREGLFYGTENTPMDVPIESRFSISDLNYIVIERLAIGRFLLECEATGEIGNQQFGTLLPITHIPNLVRAQLAEVLVPGQDEESDESLRQRYYEIVNEPAFGGNVSDYKHKVNGIDGVGAVKVFPVWRGGGTVKCTLIASDWSEPSPQLVEEVQTIIDPKVNSGLGLGSAPIAHEVTIEGVSGVRINIESEITVSSSLSVSQLQTEIEAAIETYLLEQRQDWANQERITIRTAQVVARILTVHGVEDVGDTKINGLTENSTLQVAEIPILDSVIIHG